MIRRTVFAGLLALALSSLYLGVLSPYIRAREYIKAVQALSSIRTLQEFEERFNRALLFPSPVGKEEIVKFLGNDILSIVSQPNQPEAVARALVEFIEPHLFENNVRHQLLGGQLHMVLWQRYGRKTEDFARAEAYFKAALVIGPKLPPVLFSLLDLYRKSGNDQRANEIRSVILGFWPDATI